MPKRWVFAGAGGTAVSAAEAVLQHPDTVVTLAARSTPDGLLENTQFRAMAAAHGDAGVAAMTGGRPGDGRLKVIIEGSLDFGVPKAEQSSDGHTTYNAVPSATGDDRLVGDAYVLATGRASQLPPDVADLVLQSKRAQAEVTFKAIRNEDQHYVGYRVDITTKKGQRRSLTVTGAASRFAPPELFDASDRELMKQSRELDAPAISGNFDGGFVSSANQSHRLATTPTEKEK